MNNNPINAIDPLGLVKVSEEEAREHLNILQQMDEGWSRYKVEDIIGEQEVHWKSYLSNLNMLLAYAKEKRAQNDEVGFKLVKNFLNKVLGAHKIGRAHV